jgi:hypothetical protein
VITFFISRAKPAALPACAWILFATAAALLYRHRPWAPAGEGMQLTVLMGIAAAITQMPGLMTRLGLWLGLSMMAAFILIPAPFNAFIAGLAAAVFMIMFEADWFIKQLPGMFLCIISIGVVMLSYVVRTPGDFVWVLLYFLFTTAGFAGFNRYPMERTFKTMWAFVVVLMVLEMTKYTANFATAVVPIVPLLFVGLRKTLMTVLADGYAPGDVARMLGKRLMPVVLVMIMTGLPMDSSVSVTITPIVLAGLWMMRVDSLLANFGKKEPTFREITKEAVRDIKTAAGQFSDKVRKGRKK